MKKILVAVAALVAVIALPAIAGEWHTGNNNMCTDCHTMHFSMQHGWAGGPVTTASGGTNGDWLGATGPNKYLLKAPANELCLACHDGQTFAPDVLGTNTNASPANGREAGALNEAALGAPYEQWKGHTLGSTAVPPGYDPTKVGLSATWYDATAGLECTSCHTQHGIAGVYRNLGPRALGSANLPTYVISTTNTPTADVWINLASYTANSGDPTTFNPFYATANVSFNRNDKTVGTTKTSNGIDTMCGSCHGNFHGGPGDTEIGAAVASFDGFIRHPTSQTTIGTLGSGHSTLSRYTGATTKVKTYSNNTDFTNASPGCITCHKAHGNQNPFGLVFLNRAAAAVDEQGGIFTGQTNDLKTGYRNLCGQCHGQGNS